MADTEWVGPKQARRPFRTIVGLVVVVVVVGAVLSYFGGRTPPVGPQELVSWTLPAGFRLTTDPPVAFRWLEDSEFECQIVDECWGMAVIPKEGRAASLDAELSITDPSGNAVGYTNDTAGAVRAGQRAKMIFPNLEATSSTARLSDVACR